MESSLTQTWPASANLLATQPGGVSPAITTSTPCRRKVNNQDVVSAGVRRDVLMVQDVAGEESRIDSIWAASPLDDHA
jgi:hypothetical protein